MGACAIDTKNLLTISRLEIDEKDGYSTNNIYIILHTNINSNLEVGLVGSANTIIEIEQVYGPFLENIELRNICKKMCPIYELPKSCLKLDLLSEGYLKS